LKKRLVNYRFFYAVCCFKIVEFIVDETDKQLLEMKLSWSIYRWPCCWVNYCKKIKISGFYGAL